MMDAIAHECFKNFEGDHNEHVKWGEHQHITVPMGVEWTALTGADLDILGIGISEIGSGLQYKHMDALMKYPFL